MKLPSTAPAEAGGRCSSYEARTKINTNNLLIAIFPSFF
ncbi:Uncharacterized protein dnm_096150 [Desulfonema magnum]|uniref:Uncharacterized protein n=1 Tax=Desulfonema magnum TaxID=45655 RepID=A0A975BXA1_9BACT|nr:Uncharacterized protein dnm_096150 [Desulfonema magnum]